MYVILLNQVPIRTISLPIPKITLVNFLVSQINLLVLVHSRMMEVGKILFFIEMILMFM